MRLDVVLVTYGRAPELDEDETPLGPALERLGLSWRAVAWDDRIFDWSSTRLAVLRSPWDYSRRRDEFLAWARRAASATTLLNPVDVVERNTHKGYLLDLARLGLPVIPTVMTRPEDGADPIDVARRQGWAEIVVKPAVSAGSWRTWRMRVGTEAVTSQEHDVVRARRLVATKEALIQPFLPSVTADGERALVFFDGRLSHAIRKRSLFEGEDVAPRVPVEPTVAELALANAVLEAEGAHGLLYARVDVASDADGVPLLMELELTEPRLFFREAPATAIDAFAAAIARRLR